MDGILAYRGEFAKNNRHGFGVAFFGPNHRYVGRFEDNAMAGLGIYCHPNGDRFEGMFYFNKPDGAGSFYETDSTSGKVTSTHAIWQKGRKIKEVGVPFVPKSVDLPDDSGDVSCFFWFSRCDSNVMSSEPSACYGCRRRKDAQRNGAGGPK